MNEQQLTAKAIQYLAQVVEAYSAVLQTGQLENATSAIHCIRYGAQHIQKISQNSLETENVKHRMWAIRDAMIWLSILRKRQQEVDLVAGSGMPLPSENEIQSIQTAANMYRES